MALKKHRPISPGRRFRVTSDFAELTKEKDKDKKKRPPKKLLKAKNRINGRNVYGRITVRRRGGCLLYTSPSPRDATLSRMPSSA